MRVGTTPEGNDIFSAPSCDYHTKPGNVGHTLTWKIKNLTKAAIYYFHIQTVDSGFRGSQWIFTDYLHDPNGPDVDNFITHDNFLHIDECCIITYNLGKASKVTIEIINLEGAVVKTIIEDEQKPAGYNPDDPEKWCGENESGNKVAPGIYWVVFKTEHWRKMKRVIPTRTRR